MKEHSSRLGTLQKECSMLHNSFFLVLSLYSYRNRTGTSKVMVVELVTKPELNIFTIKYDERYTVGG